MKRTPVVLTALLSIAIVIAIAPRPCVADLDETGVADLAPGSGAGVTVTAPAGAPGRLLGPDASPTTAPRPYRLPGAERPDAAHRRAVVPPGARAGVAARRPLWQRLETLAPEARVNAEIQLELPGDLAGGGDSNDGSVGRAAGDAATRIESSWNSGRHAEAITALARLEEMLAPRGIAIAVSWREPGVSGTGRWSNDRMISDRWYVDQVGLDFDAPSGHLFAVLRTVEAGGDYWSVHMSVDQGVTWQETAAWFSSVEISDVSCAVVDAYLYVAYNGVFASSECRLRRCLVDDGTMDTGYGFETVLDVGSDVVDLAISTNADWLDNRIYYLAIVADHRLLFAWSTAENTTWYEVDTGVTNASYGLDAACNEGYATYYLVASYRDVDEVLHLARRASGGWAADTPLPGDTAGETRVAAYQDRIMLAYWADLLDDIYYYVSYDQGSNWYFGDIASGVGHVYVSPDVTGRRGGGFRAVYHEAISAGDVGFTIRRDYGTGPGTAPWSDPVQFNDDDLASGTSMATEWVPPVSGTGDAHGIVWIGSIRNAYFDRSDLETVGIVESPASDGTAAAPALTAWPLPVRSGEITIAFTAGGDGVTRLALYDVAGRLIRRLARRPFAPGEHVMTWDGRDAAGRRLPAGTYWLRVDDAQGTAVRKVAVLR